MSKITKDDVLHSAELARIKIEDSETGNYTNDLEEILEFVEKLESAPTEDIEAAGQVTDLKNVTRKDEVAPSLGSEKVVENAPAKKDSFIKTKPVFE